MKVLSIGTLFLLLGCQLFQNQDSIDDFDLTEKPNFLVIITDDQRYDALGFVQRNQGDRGRFPWFETPGIDALAKSGSFFSNAFVVSSLCSPSRASILTGQYGHTNGIKDNSTEFTQDSFIHTLQNVGYQTSYFGKWHMGNQSGQRPGFDYSYSFVGQGEYLDQDFEKNGKVESSKGWVDDVITKAAISWLQKPINKPFCMIIGFKSAHGPWDSPPERTKNLYVNKTIGSTPNKEKYPPYDKESILSPIAYSKRYQSEDLVYFEYLKAIDDNIFELTKALDSLKLRENTIIVFLSDNGFYMGEHGLHDKRSAYEESMRIPLILSGPGIPKNKIYEEIALNIDLAPTLLNLIEIPIESFGFQGESLKKVFENETWRDSFYYEYFKEKIGPQVNISAVRNQQYKIIWYEDHPEWTELFDLKNDPYETKNLYGLPKYSGVINELTSKRLR